ncbi:hypothetical protein [Streptacidiphilus sp. EB103A]|uniref:hypothetical protein n=1 Tax=Streptacidiphilus sp. EB103A TaxID=3156275 RepID=UPI003513C36C
MSLPGRAARLRRSARVDREQPQARPTMRMKVQRNAGVITAAALGGAHAAGLEGVLMPDDEPTLLALVAIATGSSRAHLYVRPAGNEGHAVLCVRGPAGAVPVTGQVSMAADVLFARTRSAVLALAVMSREAGRQAEADRWRALGRQMLAARREANRGHSVRALNGGLPTLGHHN